MTRVGDKKGYRGRGKRGKPGEKHPSGAKARINLVAVTYGLKARTLLQERRDDETGCILAA